MEWGPTLFKMYEKGVFYMCDASQGEKAEGGGLFCQVCSKCMKKGYSTCVMQSRTKRQKGGGALFCQVFWNHYF